MIIIKSSLFAGLPGVILGVSTKKHGHARAPFYFNMSFSVGDDEKKVHRNQKLFFDQLHLKDVAVQKQIHSDIITAVDKPGNCGESDAMITSCQGLALGISIADCTPVFVYDRKNRVVAGIHSGWRGTQKRIVEKTLEKLSLEYNSSPEDIFAYIGPSISQDNYEVDADVAGMFDEKYTRKTHTKYLLDVKRANYDMLTGWGIPEAHVQMSALCTFEMKDLLHSYRRDAQNSGRLLGVIALADNAAGEK